jgi:hypothetical protein
MTLTTSQVGKLCGTSRTIVLEKWIKGGKLPAKMVEGGASGPEGPLTKHYQVEEADLVAFIKRSGMPMPDGLSAFN